VGDQDAAEEVLTEAVDGACRYRLPHQVQRVMRIAGSNRRPDLLIHASAGFAVACAGSSAGIPA